ncbi:hypothetical protein HF521_007535 [Silurus meridionalis]|uniref:Uncharacterized protein n=1 Tax=Silurus meridionalis TaxID=175797 RepID=A0A8T0ALI8_SILME|nr:hypothetical protein HF521_007535 [Silurus meridionalis]
MSVSSVRTLPEGSDRDEQPGARATSWSGRLGGHKEGDGEVGSESSKPSINASCVKQKLLPVCESWEDTVWAYLRVLVNSLEELKSSGLSHKKLEELPKE